MQNKKDNKNRIIIQKIIEYCNIISELINRFGSSFESYNSDMAFQLSTNMCVFQIGELTTRLSDNFKEQHSEIPWHDIKAMRNIHAHEYENEYMWTTLIEDIPDLKEKLTEILDEMKEK